MRTLAFLAMTVLTTSAVLAQETPQAPKRRIKVGSDPTSNSPDPEGDARRMNQAGERLDAAKRQFATGDLAACRASCRRILTLDPDEENAACLLADVAFREGRSAEAYATVSPFVQTGAPPRVLLRAALAAALRGMEQDGMEEYCRNFLADGPDPRAYDGSLPSLRARSSVAVCAALALAQGTAFNDVQDAWADLYYGVVLRLDPRNPIANANLAELDKRRKRWVSARKRMSIAARSGNERIRSSARIGLREIDIAEGSERTKRGASPGSRDDKSPR